MPRVHGYWFGGMLLGWLLAVKAQRQTVWHVDDDAPPGGDGAAWATAFNGL